MPLNVNDVIAGLVPAQRCKVEELAVELVAEEMTLRELRKAPRQSPGRALGHRQARDPD